MVNGQCIGIVPLQCQTYHTAELTWERVSDDRDDADGPKGNQREGDAVIARNNVEIGRFVLMMSSICVMSPEASLTAITFLKSRAMRRVVSAFMFTPIYDRGHYKAQSANPLLQKWPYNADIYLLAMACCNMERRIEWHLLR